MSDPSDPKSILLDAILLHVAFDGWSETALRAAIKDTGLSPSDARAACPRGAVDLALAYHARGDALMRAALAGTEISGLRVREKVALAVRKRLAVIDNREAVRRAAALFALPNHAVDGTRALWSTADAIWTAIGDRSEDYNWYTKRATLAGVWGATVLYWLGDDSLDSTETRAFIDRRIDDVMRIETVKSRVRKAPVIGHLANAAERALSRIHPPGADGKPDLPGIWRPGETSGQA